MPHVGRIPSTLEKYRHALSAYLEDITQLNFKSSASHSQSYSFLYFDEKTNHKHIKPQTHSSLSNLAAHSHSKSQTPIPDTQTRINSSYKTVKKQLDLLSSYFSLIHDDLHGDLLLLRTNLNLLPSNTLHIAQQNNNHSNGNSNANSSLHIVEDSANAHSSAPHTPLSYTPQSILTSDNDTDLFNSDNILNTKQTQSIQYIVSILQKFIKYNSILVEHIQQNKSKIDSYWVQNHILNHPQTHQLNLDVESIISTMCVKDLIHTKSYSCHNILFHDILGCANTKQFFTRIYFIVSIWYSFFHLLHLSLYHDDDEDNDDDTQDDHDSNSDVSVKPCNTYLTKLFAMTDFSFLTKSNAMSNSNSSSTASSTVVSTNSTHNNPNILSPQSSGNSDSHSHSHTHSSADSHYQWSSSSNIEEKSDAEIEEELSFNSCNSTCVSSSNTSKNDFLLKYLNAQNNYLQSIWHDGIALLEYSLHLLQQQEFRLSCRVAHRCLELFQKQQMEQERIRQSQRRERNWNHLQRDLYDEEEDTKEEHKRDNNRVSAHSPHGAHGAGLFMVDPVTNQPAQIPGLWYIEMHLANCYHTWGQSNMALYHINRTLDQLGNYQINPDTLTVRLNTRRKFKLLSGYLVHQAQRDLRTKKQKEQSSNHKKRRSFMRKIKINNRRGRRKSNVFSKLFDRFSKNKKNKTETTKVNEQNSNATREESILSSIEDEKEETEMGLQLCLSEDLELYDNDTNENEIDIDDMSGDIDFEDENDLDNDNDIEASFFHNDTDNMTDNESVNEQTNVQMITLEALLSMHMTKGRILIEMKLLREALDLYTYIINECEALIQYHSLINPHHLQLESEYEKYDCEETAHREEEEEEKKAESGRRRRRRRSNHNITPTPTTPPPNTPFRRLTKNIGLENYYAARGDIYFKFKDLHHALRDFSNAIKYGKCKKEMGIYYNLRGVCFHEMKQYERALKDYDNAVKSMYGNHVAWNNRAALLVDMRKYDMAIENANNAIKLDPSYGNAYKHRGVAYHLKGKFEKAITDINRCIKLLPNYRPARLALLAIWKDIFSCVRVVNIDEGVPLDLVKIMVDYTVGNGYEIDEYMVNFTYC